MNNLPLHLVRILIVTVIVGFGVMLPFISRTESEFMLMLFGLLALLAASIPILVRREFCLFEPITFVVLLVLTGVTLKLLYICIVGQDRDYIAQRLLLNQDPSKLLYGTIMVTIGIFMMSIGYCMRLPKLNMDWIYMPRRNEWHGKRLQVAILVLWAISAVFFALFVITVGVSTNSLEELSAKRFSDEAGDSALRITRLPYYFYRGAALSKFVFYLALTWMVHRGMKVTSGMGVVVVLSMIQTMALFFVMSSRASIVLLLIDALVIYYLLQEKVELKKFIAAGALAFGLLIVMLASRDTGDHTVGDLIERTFAGRDLLDVSKSCHIINAIPDKIDYCYGETLYGFLVAPIPRSMWEDKPMWAERGQYLMQHVYGDVHGKTGMPPGMIAEFYWNYGVTGVVAGMFFMGIVFRQIYLIFEPHRRNPTSVLIYTIIVTRLVIFALGTDFGTGILKVGLDLVPLGILFLFIGVNVPQNDDSTFPQGRLDRAGASPTQKLVAVDRN